MTQLLRSLIVVSSLLALPIFAATTPAADEAYKDAKADVTELKNDASKRKFRHHWLNAAHKLEKVIARFPKSDRAPEALFNTGELYAELSRFSKEEEDLAAAEGAYKKLIEGWPAHRLADDGALALARLLSERREDSAGARKVIDAALERGGGDRKGELKRLLAALPEEKKPGKAAVADRGKKPVAGEPVLASREPRAALRPSTALGTNGSERKTPPLDSARGERGGADSARGERGGADSARGERGGADSARGERGGADSARGDRGGADSARGERGGADSARAERVAPAPAPVPPPAAKQESASSRGAAVVGQLEKALKAVGRVAVLEPERAKQPAAKLGGEDEEAAGARVHARRLPALRPEGDGEEAHEEAGETTDGLHLPKLTDLQERLRDVRVGTPAPVLRVGDAVARARLKQAAKDGQNAELTLAEQLGLKMRRVVIDAGHGGHDTGAIGPTGVQEKDVTLQIALQVAKKLEAAGLEVLLTRDDDTFVRLEDRAQIANTHKGDLFVSIHCNAAPSRTLRGIETYTLNTSADRYSIRLAARENASSERGVSDLQFILADLATKANTEESTRLARRVQKSLVKDLSAEHKGIRDLGTKEALFFVLLGAKMPAILVETSFLSHPDEEKLLGSAEYQTEVAASISDAVTGFLEEREAKLARVD